MYQPKIARNKMVLPFWRATDTNPIRFSHDPLRCPNKHRATCNCHGISVTGKVGPSKKRVSPMFAPFACFCVGRTRLLFRSKFCAGVFLFRRFCAWYSAPRRELHGLHAGTISVSSPTRSHGTRWSASVAGRRLHQWQFGLSRKSAARFFRYAVLAVRLGI
jgi:hypothetical protein